MQGVADDLDIRSLFLQHRQGDISNRMTEDIVLIDQIDLFYGFFCLDIIGNGGHLHSDMGIEAEVPEAALFVGKGRCHRRIIKIDHQIIRIAFIVLVDGIDQRAGHTGTVALGDESNSLIDGAFKLNQGFVGADFAVKGDNLNFLAAQNAPLGVDQIRHVLKMLVARITDIRQTLR